MITIHKSKITKDRTLNVEYTESDNGGKPNKVSKECSQVCDKDLVKAFDKLKLHFVMLCELVEGQDLDYETFDPEKQLVDFKVTSLAINKTNDGVILTGQKKLQDDYVWCFNTRLCKYGNENEPYEYADELKADIEKCVAETNAYLFNKKWGIAQLELQPDEKQQN
jgi:hypothetical protein